MLIQRVLAIALSIVFAVVALGLIAALFAIGLVVLWYLLIIIGIIWLARRIYYFFKGEPAPDLTQQTVYYTTWYRDQMAPRQEKIINPKDDD